MFLFVEPQLYVSCVPKKYSYVAKLKIHFNLEMFFFSFHGSLPLEIILFELGSNTKYVNTSLYINLNLDSP